MEWSDFSLRFCVVAFERSEGVSAEDKMQKYIFLNKLYSQVWHQWAGPEINIEFFKSLRSMTSLRYSIAQQECGGIDILGKTNAESGDLKIVQATFMRPSWGRRGRNLQLVAQIKGLTWRDDSRRRSRHACTSKIKNSKRQMRQRVE